MTHEDRSLAELHGSVPVPRTRNWFRRMLAFAGPAYLVSVGYMDPGNWATDLAGGARFGYQLAWVLVMSNLMAVLLQTLAARLGVVTGRDLAQACRDAYPRWIVWPLWVLCELAIVACDLAEVLGAAIGLQLLFGIPLLVGVIITVLDVMLLLALSHYGIRRLEAFILTLVATIGTCFAIQMLLSNPDYASVFAHLLPRDHTGALSLFGVNEDGRPTVLGLRGESLYIAMGILGATVMPHNLYLHSALVQSREVEPTETGKREACKLNLVDSAIALNAALFVNFALLVLAAAAFHRHGFHDIGSLREAHHLLAPLLGSSLAPVLFAIALLCAGQASTVTGTLAGQIVMEGFLRVRMQPWLRRLVSRALAIVPAVAVILWKGESGVDALLVLSQVVLSLQLAFAVVPLITFTNDRRRMGAFANGWWVRVLAAIVAALIIGLNTKLAVDAIGGWIRSSGGAWWVWAFVLPGAFALAGLLIVLLLMPLLVRVWPQLAPVGPETAIATAGSQLPPAVRTEGGEVVDTTLPWDSGAHRRVVVAVELAEADDNILQFLLRARLAPGLRLVFVHVAESAASRWLGEKSHDAESREDLQALEGLAREFIGLGVSTWVRLGHGEPAREIARIVAEEQADLLITGSHGHRGFSDVVYGSTVSSVRHRVACPVLTVPPRRRR